MNMTPIKTLLKARGVILTHGQSIYLSKQLRAEGYETEKIYDPEEKKALAHIDTDKVPKWVLDRILADIKHIEVEPDLEKHPLEPAPEPVSTPTPVKPTPIKHTPVMSLESPSFRLTQALIDTATAAIEVIGQDLDKRFAGIEDSILDLSNKLANLNSINFEQAISPEEAEKREQEQLENQLLVARIKELENEVATRAKQQIASAEQVSFLEDKLAKSSSPKVQFELPVEAVWRESKWIRLHYTAEFWKDWEKLNAEQKKHIRSCLMMLTMNPFHTALHTKTRPFKNGAIGRGSSDPKILQYPSNVPQTANKSWASVNIRLWWEEKPDSVVFYRIVVKSG